MVSASDRVFRMALHLVAFVTAFGVSAWLRFGVLQSVFQYRGEPPAALYIQYAVLFGLFAVAVLILQGEYDVAPIALSPSRFSARATFAILWSLALLVLFAFFTKPVPPSRVVMALTFVTAMGLAGAVAIYEQQRFRRAQRVFYVIASGERASEMEALLRRARPNAEIVVMDANAQSVESLIAGLRERWNQTRPTGGVICALEGTSRVQHALLALTLRYNIPVKFVPSEEGFLLRRLSLEDLEGIPLLSPRPLHTSFANQAIKRALDIALALTVLVFTLPLWILLIVLIPLESPGSPFFLHQRLGQGGKPFKIYKFRTMRRGVEQEFRHDERVQKEFQERYKLLKDPRVTRLGALLRKLSLDELPQVLNVLKGEMSFIGPRPIVAEETPKYGDWADLLFAVKPGLTGLWQVSGRTDLSYEKRVQLDIYYILNWSLWMDFYILLLTPAAVLSGKGAYTL
ncbi:MAG: sugar transferase [bacterium JZ-2024 1]